MVSWHRIICLYSKVRVHHVSDKGLRIVVGCWLLVAVRTMTSCEQLRLSTLMKRRCGVKQGLRKCWFHLQKQDQNEMGRLQKRDRF